ncbi:MAG: hypothetical protein IJ796_06105 [Lachnospiraceae bacterium]|nr:hypothetical protein [Lachnospiraceae bacterium]
MKKDKGVLKFLAIVIALVIVVAVFLNYFKGRTSEVVEEPVEVTQEEVVEEPEEVEDEKEDEKFMIPAGSGFDKALADNHNKGWDYNNRTLYHNWNKSRQCQQSIGAHYGQSVLCGNRSNERIYISEVVRRHIGKRNLYTSCCLCG